MIKHTIEMSLTSDLGTAYIDLTAQQIGKSKRNQTLELIGSNGSHLGTLVFDLDAEDKLIGIEILGARQLLRDAYFESADPAHD